MGTGVFTNKKGQRILIIDDIDAFNITDICSIHLDKVFCHFDVVSGPLERWTNLVRDITPHLTRDGVVVGKIYYYD